MGLGAFAKFTFAKSSITKSITNFCMLLFYRLPFADNILGWNFLPTAIFAEILQKA